MPNLIFKRPRTIVILSSCATRFLVLNLFNLGRIIKFFLANKCAAIFESLCEIHSHLSELRWEILMKEQYMHDLLQGCPCELSTIGIEDLEMMHASLFAVAVSPNNLFFACDFE